MALDKAWSRSEAARLFKKERCETIRRFTATAEKSGHSGTEKSAWSRKRACLLPVCEQPHLQPTSRDSPGPGLHSTPKQYLNTSPQRGILQRSRAGWKSRGSLSVSFVRALTKGQSRKRSKASDCPGEGDRRYLLHDQNVKHVQDDEHQAFPPQREKGDWLGLGRPAALRPGGDWQRGRGGGRAGSPMILPSPGARPRTPASRGVFPSLSYNLKPSWGHRRLTVGSSQLQGACRAQAESHQLRRKRRDQGHHIAGLTEESDHSHADLMLKRPYAHQRFQPGTRKAVGTEGALRTARREGPVQEPPGLNTGAGRGSSGIYTTAV